MKDKKYIVYGDYNIGYIENVSTCDGCRERGRSEVFINDLDGKYLDCIRGDEIDNIIYLGNSLTEAINELIRDFDRVVEKKDKINKYLQSLIDFYTKLKTE